VEIKFGDVGLASVGIRISLLEEGWRFGPRLSLLTFVSLGGCYSVGAICCAAFACAGAGGGHRQSASYGGVQTSSSWQHRDPHLVVA
jgi:hypothetical protein